jgi:16S rRNA (cytosine1402-N4)-methyltransferase
MIYHEPVLVKEVIDSFNIEPGNIYIDGTLGHGGHSIEILKRGGIVYGLDADPFYLDIATKRISDLNLSSNFNPILSNFTDILNVTDQNISGVLLDLGLNSHQQLSSGRGFSFNDTESLDMRLNPTNDDLTAEEIINTYSLEDLKNLFSKTTQESFALPIALKIITARQRSPIKTGKRLADIISEVYLEHHVKTKIHPATKVFLALKIAVNQESENLKNFLDLSLKLTPQCQVSIITFHSGEDRIVKQFIKNHFPKSPKPVHPQFSEIKQNPLSRSAILRSYRIV